MQYSLGTNKACKTTCDSKYGVVPWYRSDCHVEALKPLSFQIRGMRKLCNNEEAPMQATLDLDRDLLKHTFRMIGIQKEENSQCVP
jgi:hypothetical protein